MYAETIRRLTIESPAKEGETITTTIQGKPGEPVILLRSHGASPSFLPALRGFLVPDDSFSIVALGTIPASGTSSFDFTVPFKTFPPGIEAVPLSHQLIVPGTRLAFSARLRNSS